jgi:hypothetical protein
MSHILPFSISGYEFRHVESDDDEAQDASITWHRLKSSATHKWRGENYIRCDQDEPYEVFSIFDATDSLWGVWSLYRIQDVSPTSISAICSPTFPSVANAVPQDSFGPDGSTVINADEVTETNAVREQFWRHTFGCIESMLLNPMQMTDGSSKSIDHFRFPSVAGGDPSQHEWSGVKDQFDRYCKIEVQFDAAGIAVRTLPGWKSVDPDPDRPVGKFFV